MSMIQDACIVITDADSLRIGTLAACSQGLRGAAAAGLLCTDHFLGAVTDVPVVLGVWKAGRRIA